MTLKTDPPPAFRQGICRCANDPGCRSGDQPLLATKMEAFLGRGNNDFLGSSDLEDIVTILDGRPEIVSEIQAADKDLQRYLRDVFRGLLQKKRFREALPGHLSPDSAGQERLPLLIERIHSIAGLSAS